MRTITNERLIELGRELATGSEPLPTRRYVGGGDLVLGGVDHPTLGSGTLHVYAGAGDEVRVCIFYGDQSETNIGSAATASAVREQLDELGWTIDPAWPPAS